MDKLYSKILSLETYLETDSIWRKWDEEENEDYSKTLQELMEEVEDKEDYEKWKKKFIAEQFDKVKDFT